LVYYHILQTSVSDPLTPVIRPASVAQSPRSALKRRARRVGRARGHSPMSDPKELIDRLSRSLEPADREPFRRATEAALADLPPAMVGPSLSIARSRRRGARSFAPSIRRRRAGGFAAARAESAFSRGVSEGRRARRRVRRSRVPQDPRSGACPYLYATCESRRVLNHLTS
jgi:hypothetical protein